MGSVRIGRIAGLAAGNEVLLPDASGHVRKRKCIQPPAHVPAQIAIGKAAHKQGISAVPETTPSWPSLETAWARRQLDTPTPMPP